MTRRTCFYIPADSQDYGRERIVVMKKIEVIKRSLSLMLVFTVTFAGCMGRVANPVPIHQSGDKEMGCEALHVTIEQVDQQLAAKEEEVTQKLGRNTIMFAAGFFLIVPFFFIDTKDAPEKERDALRQRKARLVVLSAKKDCD